MFGETFTYFLIIGSLIWTAGATLALLIMLVKDWKNGNIW